MLLGQFLGKLFAFTEKKEVNVVSLIVEERSPVIGMDSPVVVVRAFADGERRRLARAATVARRLFDTPHSADPVVLARAFLSERAVVDAADLDVGEALRQAAARAVGLDVVSAVSPEGLAFPAWRVESTAVLPHAHNLVDSWPLPTAGGAAVLYEAVAPMRRPVTVLVGDHATVVRPGLAAVFVASRLHRVQGGPAAVCHVLVDRDGARARRAA